MTVRWEATLLWKVRVDADTDEEANIFLDGLSGLDLPAMLDEPIDVQSVVVFREAVKR